MHYHYIFYTENFLLNSNFIPRMSFNFDCVLSHCVVRLRQQHKQSKNQQLFNLLGGVYANKNQNALQSAKYKPHYLRLHLVPPVQNRLTYHIKRVFVRLLLFLYLFSLTHAFHSQFDLLLSDGGYILYIYQPRHTHT